MTNGLYWLTRRAVWLKIIGRLLTYAGLLVFAFYFRQAGIIRNTALWVAIIGIMVLIVGYVLGFIRKRPYPAGKKE
ncbi:MAG: hypothetical protein GF398_00755 [Chitinivibrionales bacterium]|nr:hypothetical protein [Chitinivibrionales bacterium]